MRNYLFITTTYLYDFIITEKDYVIFKGHDNKERDLTSSVKEIEKIIKSHIVEPPYAKHVLVFRIGYRTDNISLRSCLCRIIDGLISKYQSQNIKITREPGVLNIIS